MIITRKQSLINQTDKRTLMLHSDCTLIPQNMFSKYEQKFHLIEYCILLFISNSNMPNLMIKAKALRYGRTDLP